MSTLRQLQIVQKEIDDVKADILESKKALAAAPDNNFLQQQQLLLCKKEEQLRTEAEQIRTEAEQIRTEAEQIREKEIVLLRNQAPGQHSCPTCLYHLASELC